jgi:hypothetical protein
MMVSQIFDGFWLPEAIRKQVITEDTSWVVQHNQRGKPVEHGSPEVIGARWPALAMDQWKATINGLREQRTAAPPDFLERLQKTLNEISHRFADPDDPLSITALTALPAYTGYARQMIAFVLGALDLMPLESLHDAVTLDLPDHVRHRYIPLEDAGRFKGRIRLYEANRRNPFNKFLSTLIPQSQGKLPVKLAPPEMVLGYAAGNVIGTAHLITLLAQVSALVNPGGAEAARRPFPVVLVKNSRQEALFTPLLLSAIETIDPELVKGVAVMIWDYEDTALQEYLLYQADLVITAASDFTIDQIDEVITRVQNPRQPIRTHHHGHKVSFTTIARPYLKKDTGEVDTELVHVVTTLAAVDSIFWDQYGCLSSRVHFIERGGQNLHTPLEYGESLAQKMRALSTYLPRGAIPLTGLHNRFEKWAALTSTGLVHLCSNYEDDFLVIVDERPWSAAMFGDTINDCIERTVVIRPVDDIAEVPGKYLTWLRPENLQTMSVAIDGQAHRTWSPKFAAFVEAIGERGVTGVRTIGRGPFPQLAYSWDGFLPMDLSVSRPAGRFTSVEFENTYQEIIDTYALFQARGGFIGDQ